MGDNWPSFDQLKQIAQDNPQELEAFRKAKIDALIAQAPESYRRRLRGIQFQVDCAIKRHKTPMGACISVSKMMQDSLARLNEALHGTYNQDHKQERQDSAGESAAIIAFPAA